MCSSDLFSGPPRKAPSASARFLLLGERLARLAGHHSLGLDPRGLLLHRAQFVLFSFVYSFEARQPAVLRISQPRLVLQAEGLRARVVGREDR